jgi:hypothetical protein
MKKRGQGTKPQRTNECITGRCVNCARPSRPGYTTCQQCCDRQTRYRAVGKCARCQRAVPSPGFATCADCRSRDKNIRYTPLDEVLSTTPVRAMRALRHIGWISQLDLRDLLGYSEASDRNALSVAMTRLTKLGYVERTLWMHGKFMSDGNGYWYRITDAGRQWLTDRLKPNLEVASDEEIAAHDAELAQYGRGAA